MPQDEVGPGCNHALRVPAVRVIGKPTHLLAPVDLDDHPVDIGSQRGDCLANSRPMSSAATPGLPEWAQVFRRNQTLSYGMVSTPLGSQKASRPILCPFRSTIAGACAE